MNVSFGTKTPFRLVSSAATRSVTPIGGYKGCDVGEILQAGDQVVCDGYQYAGGECKVDLGVEAGLDVSVLWLG